MISKGSQQGRDSGLAVVSIISNDAECPRWNLAKWITCGIEWLGRGW